MAAHRCTSASAAVLPYDALKRRQGESGSGLGTSGLWQRLAVVTSGGLIFTGSRPNTGSEGEGWEKSAMWRGIMFGKVVAVLALASSCLVAGAGPSLAASESSPWYDTNSNAAQSRANPTEHVLTASAATKIRYLRNITAPPTSPQNQCPQGIAAPVLVGGYLYAMTGGQLSKYNAATGGLIWRRNPDPTFSEYYLSLAISGNLVIVGAIFCFSNSEPGGTVYAFNASTGAFVWSSGTMGAELSQAVVSGSYVVAAGTDAAGYEVSVFNLSNGKTVWWHLGCFYGDTLPLVVGGLVMTYNCDSQGNQIITASNLATGAPVWSLSGSWTLQRGDLGGAAGKHLYATDSSGTVVDLNPLTGKAVYSLSQAVNVLAVDTSRVYATCGSQGAYVCAYNISTGALEWQNTQFLSSPALAAEADGVLYLDSGAALNAATGRVITTIWSPFNNSPATAVAVGDGRIAVVTDPRVLDLFGLPGY